MQKIRYCRNRMLRHFQKRVVRCLRFFKVLSCIASYNRSDSLGVIPANGHWSAEGTMWGRQLWEADNICLLAESDQVHNTNWDKVWAVSKWSISSIFQSKSPLRLVHSVIASTSPQAVHYQVTELYGGQGKSPNSLHFVSSWQVEDEKIQTALIYIW